MTATTTTAELLDQLHNGRNRTLDHEHLSLNEIHRLTGQQRLFDTVFVYENYPTDAAKLSGDDGLAVTDLTNRDHYHYPLAIQAVPGTELDLRVQYHPDVFDDAGVDGLIEQFKRVLVAMITDPTQPLMPADPQGGAITVRTGESPDRTAEFRAPANRAERTVTEVYARVLGVARVGADDSFFDLGGDSLSAMRAIAAINTALYAALPVTALFDAPTAALLSRAASAD